MAHKDGEHMDQERQNAEIERLKTMLNNVGGGVPLMGREERAIHSVLAMATLLRGALDDFMYAGAAVSSECPKTLDRLLALFQDTLGAIRGTTIIPVEENVALLLAKCEDAILDMERARGVETRLKDSLAQGERYSKMAESMAANQSDEPRPTN